MIKRVTGMLMLLATSMLTYADQTIIPNYNKTQQDIFWQKLYHLGGWTLYCGAPFYAKARGLQIEHVYPASWMADHLGCGSRPACRTSSDTTIKTRFNHMEADLHNLFPAMTWANNRRSDHAFGLIAGEDAIFEECDLEKGIRTRDNATIIEPRLKARGEIARSVFYMHQEYGLPIDAPLGELLKAWNRADPPSWDERRRNNKIQELQGTKNLFIDNPALANTLTF